jgi:nitrite reductase/ring-hydroxylating ferredoxin subunit
MSDFSPVVPVDAVAPGKTAKFVLTRDGRELEAFVLNHDGRLVAYVNRCCHIPMTMDWVENQFSATTGRTSSAPPTARCTSPTAASASSARRSASASPPCRSRWRRRADLGRLARRG